MRKSVGIICLVLTLFLVFSAGCISTGGSENALELALLSTVTGQNITEEDLEKIKEVAAVLGDGDEELGVGDLIALSEKEFTAEELALLEQYGLIGADGSIDYAAALSALNNPDFNPEALAQM